MIRKKIFFLLALLVLALTIVSLTGCLKKKTEPTHPASETREENEPSNRAKDQEQSEKDRVQLEEATFSMDLEKCEKISDKNLKRSCKDTVLLEKAKNTMNETVCDQTSTEEVRAICVERVEQSNSQKAE